LKFLRTDTTRSPVFMHPVIFVGASVLLGALFALQEWMSEGMMSYRVSVSLLLRAWGLQYFLWGVICWLLWRLLGAYIERTSLLGMVLQVLPLSIVTSIVEEMIWVACFPNLPLNHKHMAYWHRLAFHLNAELVDNIVIFWCAFALFRGISYYQKYREKENATVQLEVQLAQAQMRTLRMQLNPHFLFNTMNSISSLMRTDVSAADEMLEQLSSLLRIALDRGEVQLISLSDEMEFIETYLAMQDRRFVGRVRHELFVEPDLHDALVPAMLLQPVIENAYVHGLSRLGNGGIIVVTALRSNAKLCITVINSGVGLQAGPMHAGERHGVGLANVRARMRLHYGEEQSFAIEEVPPDKVKVSLMLPLQFSERPTKEFSGYGV
jgi:two-component system, LytTR family, sensor kinase